MSQSLGCVVFFLREPLSLDGLRMKPRARTDFHAKHFLIRPRSTVCCLFASPFVRGSCPRFQLVQNYITSIDDAWVGKSGETKK